MLPSATASYATQCCNAACWANVDAGEKIAPAPPDQRNANVEPADTAGAPPVLRASNQANVLLRCEHAATSAAESMSVQIPRLLALTSADAWS